MYIKSSNMLVTSKNLKPITKGDKLLKGFLDKKLCKTCKKVYHPESFEECWNCWSKRPARITQYEKQYDTPEQGFESPKDWEESTTK